MMTVEQGVRYEVRVLRWNGSSRYRLPVRRADHRVSDLHGRVLALGCATHERQGFAPRAARAYRRELLRARGTLHAEKTTVWYKELKIMPGGGQSSEEQDINAWQRHYERFHDMSYQQFHGIDDETMTLLGLRERG